MKIATVGPYLDRWALPQLTSEQIAYLAGMFDGEGCISHSKKNKWNGVEEGRTGIQICVVNTHVPVLELFKAAFGGCIWTKPLGRMSRQRASGWHIGGKRAAHALHCMEPYLTIKHEQCVAALVFAETYFSSWRSYERPGWPLTEEGRRLRRVAFGAMRQATMARTGRGIEWSI